MKIPINKTQQAKIRRALVRLIRANIDDTNKGVGHPEDWPLIETELRSARAAFWSLFGTDGPK